VVDGSWLMREVDGSRLERGGALARCEHVRSPDSVSGWTIGSK
jgi:hypothetical protein